MQLTVRVSLLILSLWVSQAGAATITYLGTATETSDLLQAFFMTDLVDIHAELEFEALPGMSSDDPAVVVDARVAIGAIPAIGFCYSVTFDSCDDILTKEAILPLWVQSVESLSFDDSGVPIAGILTLTGLTRSPWPTDIVFDFSTNQWTYGFLFASANGSFARVVPLPAAVYLFGSGLLWIVGIGARRRFRAAGESEPSHC